ncbi:hypothetical protein A7985_24820 [Pseudoalteromonas luteoviolacea]|uniref:MobA-like NTP transferase domain-containing protein n=1 Tax=Pseudoalteromonas luteoviolacea TaxID=43657 RepID=A0A1C0TIP8_9GAMM|nr:NTP transferase domain-containing protein [Pseudoalteromonas luteoviolacea]MBQ4814433.1 NTP transferase domain-containing protein [Pseudoalteromonas luteoviolacea]OCQ18169.1 hypothetical protein A7985_24820 [Pseudoalteromonas luteoviolacea]
MTYAALPSLVVLAGGLGTRFGGGKQIAELPKLGRTIMELSIIDAYNAGVRHIVLVINETVRDVVESRVLPRLPTGLRIDLVEQSVGLVPSRFASIVANREKPWGTGHALLCAKPFVSGNAIVITADDYYGPNAYVQLVEHFCSANHDTSKMAIVAYPLSQTMSEVGGVNRGVCKLHNNHLVSVQEYTDIKHAEFGFTGVHDKQLKSIHESALASMTCWGITQTLFTHLESQFERFLESHDSDVKKEYYLPDCIQHMINLEQTTVRVYSSRDRWFGVTYKEEIDSVAGKIHELRHG